GPQAVGTVSRRTAHARLLRGGRGFSRRTATPAFPGAPVSSERRDSASASPAAAARQPVALRPRAASAQGPSAAPPRPWLPATSRARALDSSLCRAREYCPAFPSAGLSRVAPPTRVPARAPPPAARHLRTRRAWTARSIRRG